MHKTILLYLLLLPISLFSQVNHWETVIQEGNEWQYLIPTTQPDIAWVNQGYDASAWGTGNSGFGYGDGDDNVVIPSSMAVYLRKEFNIVDLGAIEDALLYMDFDDGFVAYLNGVEIARQLMSGSPPNFDQPSDDQHEARLYQNQIPEKFNIDKSLLNQGVNILAVEVHNVNQSSSDLTANPFLILGINDESTNYNPNPNWFVPPFVAFTSSQLPIVTFNSNGSQIVDEPKVTATIGIIFNGEGVINKLSDPFNELEALCGIEIRGESSQSFDKKSYGFEMRDELGNDIDTSFLNFPAEEDFILHGPFSDKSLLNNVLAMKIGRDMGRYASRTRFVELVINNEYRGVYVLMEKIKVDNNRLDIAKLNSDEIAGDDLTGGYIFRIDKGVYDGWWSKYNIFNSDRLLYFQFFYPSPEKIVNAQKSYIHNYMDQFEEAVASPTFENSTENHYTQYINLRSFVDTFILNELSKNVDAYRLSSYFHKDKNSKGGKITAGPFWDFNLAFGNGDYCSGDDTAGWEYYQCSGNSPFWWDAMLQDTTFNNALRCRWEDLRTKFLNTTTMNARLDSMANVLSGAQERNFQKWQIMGTYVWPNPAYFSNATSHDMVIIILKNWLRSRSIWLDNNIPGVARNCTLYDDPNFEISPILGLAPEKTHLEVYPNPTQSSLNIRSHDKIDELILSNMTGRLVLKKEVSENIATLELEGLAPGIYILKVKIGGKATTKKVFVK